MSIQEEYKILLEAFRGNHQNLENVLQQIHSNRLQNTPKNIFNKEKLQLINQLSQMNTNQKLTFSINRSLETIKMQMGENHYLIAHCNTLNDFSIKDHSLPNTVTIAKNYNSLKSLVEEFTTAIDELGDYFEAMENLDAFCWIIDPVNPSPKENFRRIIIDEDVSIIVTVGFGGCQESPNIKVMGPSRLSAPILKKMHETSSEWDPNMSMTDNLLQLLGMSHFPKPPQQDPGAEHLLGNANFECSICLSDRDLTDSLPSIICENSYCMQKFHTGCLYQWLSAVSSNVERMDTIYGECPSCSFTISCPVQNKFDYM